SVVIPTLTQRPLTCFNIMSALVILDGKNHHLYCILLTHTSEQTHTHSRSKTRRCHLKIQTNTQINSLHNKQKENREGEGEREREREREITEEQYFSHKVTMLRTMMR